MAAWLGRAWGWRSRVNATLVLLIVAGLVAFLGVSVVSNYTAAGDAVSSLNRARELTARRIDRLNGQIAALSHQNARAQRQRGLLIAEVTSLTKQLRALGVTPIATFTPQGRPTTKVIVRTTPHPTVTKTVTPKPSHHPSPTPEPSKSCAIRVLICLP